ncbi:MAG: sensor histidine kinase [Acidimicrobiia bacterium]|nr:sensor histidine kinase [Acidimicrobiia bacterium]
MDAWWNQAGTRQADALTFLVAAVSIAALLARRRRPLAVALVCGAGLSVWFAVGHHGELLNLPTMVALYTVAVQGTRRRSVIVGAIASIWSAGLAVVFADPVGSPMLELIWPLIPVLLGEVVRARQELLAEYGQRAARAEADREAEAQRRVQEERLRIAREFHDIVAHTMVAVNLHMSVAVKAFGSRPEVAEQALVQARASSREALAELRATVGLLRDEHGPTSSAPAPTLDQLGELVEGARAGGLEVAAEVVEGSGELPGVVGLAAYRIVQEALTNVVSHARARRVAVRVASDGERLVVEVVDDGVGPARLTGGGDRSVADRSGLGLVGMAERVAALGGTLEHGPGALGGFRVRASLPLGGPEG